MAVLALLDDGSCTITGQCLRAPHEVHERCPQAMKCGTCVAWSPREENGYGRNSGQCMLDRDARVYLDCNAPICPYYRPRQSSPAYAEWQKTPPEQQREARKSAKKLDREAPPPSASALAMAAFADQPAGVAERGALVLEAELVAHGKMPVLLERFRGGTVALNGPAQGEATVEAFFARLALLRRTLDALEGALASSSLTADEKDKIGKDLAGIGGSLTTFNFLFKERDDAFRGQGGKA